VPQYIENHYGLYFTMRNKGGSVGVLVYNMPAGWPNQLAAMAVRRKEGVCPLFAGSSDILYLGDIEY